MERTFVKLVPGFVAINQKTVWQPLVLITVVLVSFVILSSTHASETESAQDVQKGLEIAIAARAADQGFENFTGEMVMTLRNRQGKENKRHMRVKVLEVEGDGNKSIFTFDRPRDVKGTAFLVHSHLDKADDQWLYLPALKRVKRIHSSNRSGSFMGSEFAYEDITTPEVKRYTYKWLRDEPCGELTCTVSEWLPALEGSGYSRLIVWHDTQLWRIWKTEYYDHSNSHLKTMTKGGYKQYLNKYERAEWLKMVNHLTGKSTDLNTSNYQFRTDLNEGHFTKTALQRAR